MSMLNRKLLRDLVRLWAQILAISLVMAGGAATLILAIGAYRALDDTRATFYERNRFAHVFASVERAPIELADQLRAIDGVRNISLRIAKGAIVDVIGMAEPASGLAISLPDSGDATTNRPYLRSGRLPQTARVNEVAVIESFAKEHGLRAGDTFSAVMNGHKHELTISGIVLSPEFIYAIGPGDLVPDPSRYAVFFMARSTLEGLFDMEGAFNDFSATLTSGANEKMVLEQLDRLLARYGSLRAYGRKDQISHAFLDNELSQLEAMAFVIPPIFLFVSAFLVNMVLSRMIGLERAQIGLLKAVGYTNAQIASHYAKLVVAIALVGLIIGSGAGAWLGRALALLYSRFFHFPYLLFRESPELYAIAGGITILAALFGAGRAIYGAVALPPAEAMRPPSPTRYKRSVVARTVLRNLFSPTTKMAFRHIGRRPLRTAMSITGISLSVALLITALFSFDSIDHMIDMVFFKAERQDAMVTFINEKAPVAEIDARNLPGVIRVEPFRSLPVTIRNGHRERQISIAGTRDDADLSQILDTDFNVVSLPKAGIMMSDYLAGILDVQVGDQVEIDLLMQGGRAVSAPVTAIVQSYIGLTAYMDLEALNRLSSDGMRISGVRLEIDDQQLPALYDAIKSTPSIGRISLLNVSREQFRATIEENISSMTTVYVVLAIIITFGVIYNSARIQLAEHARELASLRVLGYTKGEASSVLLVELAILTVIAQPVGWALGYSFSWSVVRGFESELFRIPLIISASTFSVSSLIVAGAAVISSLIVRRRVDRLDLVRVLKTRE